MAKQLYRDQIERFYDLEVGEYSRGDIGSLCDIAESLITVWRREPPYPEDYPVRPPLALPLPNMRPPKPIPKGGIKWTSTGPGRAKRPPPRAQEPEHGPPGDVTAPLLPDPRVSSRSTPPAETRDVPPTTASGPQFLKPGPPPAKPSSKPLKTIPEKNPPGGKAEAQRQGALRPVTKGQLDKAVAKEVAAARAEMLREIKAAGFDPAVTWTTEVNHEAFDPVKALVQLAHVPGCPENTILGILRTLVALKKERAKVAWETVRLEDIPVEHRPRLAGQLVEWLEVAELPMEVAEHPVLREVYELTGVALPRAVDADEFMARWEQVLEDMRTDAEARTEVQRAAGRLVMDGPPKRAAEFRVKPSTGSPST